MFLLVLSYFLDFIVKRFGRRWVVVKGHVNKQWLIEWLMCIRGIIAGYKLLFLRAALRTDGCLCSACACVCVCVSLFIFATVTCIQVRVINPHAELDKPLCAPSLWSQSDCRSHQSAILNARTCRCLFVCFFLSSSNNSPLCAAAAPFFNVVRTSLLGASQHANVVFPFVWIRTVRKYTSLLQTQSLQ